MINYKTGNIFDEDVEAIVNTVNCVGVMGRGLALQFKKTYPENFKVYATACKQDAVQPGEMFVFETGQLMNPRVIINFPTKRHWRGKSRMGDIESGLKALVDEIRERGIRSIAIPPLGAGLGGLPWQEVRERIADTLGTIDNVQITVFEPIDAPRPTPSHQTIKPPKMTAGRAALIALMDRYLGGFLDPAISLLELHKLMYYMQVAGEPLRLKFQKAHYGPYAENLRHVLNAIEGHMVQGYQDGGDQPEKELKIVPEALARAHAFLETKSQTQGHMRRVSELVDGFESPFGLELLSTVHWVTQNGPSALDDVVEDVHGWSERKQQFSRRQIGIALDVLVSQGWCEA